MRVSVVICTLNRAQSLGETLESLRYQNYRDFEVVVVNGPSTDNTDEILKKWAGRVRLDSCPVPNLSVSRNIGIRAAGGDIVAFIDDDALPEFDWLNQALLAFDSDEVAGVGGIVFDHTGVTLQYKYSAANRFAETTARTDLPYDDQCFPGSFQFPYLQGTNALFRRDCLLRVGGFDETFDYYLDETDVCVRLIDAGYVLRQLADAPVHHKFLPSGIRDHHRVVTNWSPIMRNHVYFSYRHALGPFSEFDIHQHSLGFLNSRVEDARHNERVGRLPLGSAHNAALKCAEAFRVGIQLGLARQELRLGPVEWIAPEFTRFPTLDTANRRKITLVSSGYVPNMTGGIARFFSDLAPALAERGHEVRVITKADGPPTVDLEHGVWVHRIEAAHAGMNGVAPHVLPHINDFATSVVGEIERIGGWSSHDLVYGPLWDVEILGVLQRICLPVAVQVATPVSVAADLAGHMAQSDSANDMRNIMELERAVLEDADLFHANSTAVADTIAAHYTGLADPARWGVVHLGLIDHAASSSAGIPRTEGPTTSERSERVMVLFVGRFEVRKGIDTFLDAVAEIAAEFPNVEFVAAGEDRPLIPGLDLFGEMWLDRVKSESWANQVRFAGSVSDEELHRLYRQADVVVLPSRYESFGLVMVEAMMHGKALISCDTSGVRDVVRNEVDGVLVEPGDSAAVADALRDLLNDPARRQQLGAAGRQRFLDAFHIDRFAERFERFIERLSMRDPSSANLGQPSSAVMQRGAGGRSVAILRKGESLSFSVEGDALAALCVRARCACTITVNGAAVRLVADRVRRIPIAARTQRVQATVVHGEVEIGGLIEVKEPSI